MTSTTSSTTYTLRTFADEIGTVATWDDVRALARGYFGTTPSIRAAGDARWTVTVHGIYAADIVAGGAL